MPFIAPNARQQFEDANGNPASGYKLFTYIAGTTTKQATYTTSSGATPNANPIILNASGYTPNGVWLDAGVLYKFVLAPSTDTDPPGSPIWTEDNVQGINDSAAVPIKASQAEVITGSNDTKFVTPLTLATRITGTLMTMLNAVFTKANDTASGGGQIYLNGATGNRIDFNTSGSAAPAFTTRSVGTKIVLDPAISGATVDYAIGKEAGALWFSCTNAGTSFKWYGGTTLAASLSGGGNLLTNGSILSQSPASGIGYTTGSGASVTQTVSKSDAVTLDYINGRITMNGAALAGNTTVTFTLNNSLIVSPTHILLTIRGGVTTGAYNVWVSSYSGGTAIIAVRNITAGSLSESIIIEFALLKASIT